MFSSLASIHSFCPANVFITIVIYLYQHSLSNMQINLPSIFSALSLCSPALSLPLQARNASLTLTIHTAVVIDFKSSVLADLTNIGKAQSIEFGNHHD